METQCTRAVLSVVEGCHAAPSLRPSSGRSVGPRLPLEVSSEEFWTLSQCFFLGIPSQGWENYGVSSNLVGLFKDMDRLRPRSPSLLRQGGRRRTTFNSNHLNSLFCFLLLPLLFRVANSSTNSDLEGNIAASYKDAGKVRDLTLALDGGNARPLKIHYLAAGPEAASSHKVIVFCHGAAFTSNTWKVRRGKQQPRPPAPSKYHRCPSLC